MGRVGLESPDSPPYAHHLPYPLYQPGQIEWMRHVTQTVEVLVLDLLEWLALGDRSYEETMDAWRTSCPRLPVWEDATDHGLVSIADSNGRLIVRVTPAGLALLKKNRPGSVA